MAANNVPPVPPPVGATAMNNLPQGMRVPPVPGLHGMPGNIANGAINGGITGAMGGHPGAGAGRGVSFAQPGAGAGPGPGASFGAAGGPGPGPGPQGMQMPIRPAMSSTRISDITPKSIMDGSACKKKLTTYEAHTIRKVAPKETKDKATWGVAEFAREPLPSDDLAKVVKKLNEGKRSAGEKKAALYPYQQGQVTRLLDDLNGSERDPNFEWSLAQIDRKERALKGKKAETTLITVYVKRCVIDSVDPVAIHQAIERHKAQRMAALSRPPMPMPQGQGQGGQGQGGQGQGGQGQGGQGGNGIVNLGSKPQIVNKPKGKDKDSSVSSEFDSDSDSDTDYSSTMTSISSRSGRRGRRYSHGYRSRGRSHSKHREHVKRYYITDRPHSPEPRYRDSWHGGQTVRYVPEIPVVPAFDPVSAAYQAGKIDADAERYERYAPPRIEPRPLVTYGARDREYPYEVPRRLEDRREIPYEAPRRLDDRRYEDRFAERFGYEPRSYHRDEPYLTREELRRREAEEYIDRRPSPRIIYDHPFRPRRYATSSSSGW